MRRKLTARDHKYSRGVVAVAAGTDQYPGSALLAVGGARSGNAGYVKFLSESRRLHDLVISRYPDVVPVSTAKDSAIDALVLGPGGATLEIVPDHVPLVLDGSSIALAFADGFIGSHPITVITPHEGELRFCGVEKSTPLTHEERKVIAHQLATENDLIVVLKGHQTIVANTDGEIFVDEIGGPELATAGSGDILAGLIGSMLASLREGGIAFDLVCRAVMLHSEAGRFAAEHFTTVSALEILDSLRHV